MITAAQLRAARGLLDWTRADLAKAANISPETVKNIEHGTFRPQENTADAIIRAFAAHNVMFTEEEGVKIQEHRVRTFYGIEGYKQYLDHIYSTLKDLGGRICQFNLSDGKNLPYAGDYAAVHLARMTKVPNLDARVLTFEGDYNFPATYCTYKWLHKDQKALIPYYVYGDNISMAIIKSDNDIAIVSIHSKLMAQLYVEQFDRYWDTASVPNKKEV